MKKRSIGFIVQDITDAISVLNAHEIKDLYIKYCEPNAKIKVVKTITCTVSKPIKTKTYFIIS